MDPLRLLAPFLALLLVAAAAPAAAQLDTTVQTETQIQVFDPGEPLEPGETTSLLTAVTYRYGQGARADEPTAVRLEVLSTPPWAEAAFNTTTVTFPVPSSSAASGRTDQVEVLLNVTLEADAPAFQEETVGVRAEAEENGNLESSEGTDEQAVPPAYAARLEVDHLDPVSVPGGRDHQIPLHVQAEANAPTVVDLTLEAKPANSQVTLPEPTPLEGAAAGNASTFLDLRLRMPWTRDQEGLLTLTASPYHADVDDAVGSLQTVEMTLVGQSLVPGPGLAGVLAALAGAAAAARRS